MIKVLLFGQLQDVAHAAQLQLGSQPTPTDLIDALAPTHPELAEALRQPQVMVAIDQTIAEFDTPLTDGCEVAFMPPVTGG